MRASAEELLQHPLIKHHCSLASQVQSQVSTVTSMETLRTNFEEFSQASRFQSSIISFIVGFRRDKEDYTVLRRQFSQIDANQDGFITVDEMENAMSIFQNQFTSGLSRHDNWRELFLTFDKNGDGKISYNEFLAGATDKTKLLNEENLRVAFDAIDRNGDGLIEINDLRRRFSQSDYLGGSGEHKHVSDKTLQKMIDDFDLNNDG